MSKWWETNSPNEELDPYEDSEDDETGFVLKVETIMGNGFHVFAYPSDSVELLKTRIAFQEGIPQAEQNLLLGKRTLDNPTAILSDLGLNDESTLKIITNISSGLPYKRDTSPPLLFRDPRTANSSTTENDLKLPRLNQLNENHIDGVLVLRDKNDGRYFLIVKRSPVGQDEGPNYDDEDEEEEDYEASFDAGECNNSTTAFAIGSRRQSKREGSNKKLTKSGRDVQLERIRENAKTLKKMSEIRQNLLCQKKKPSDTENLELPKIGTGDTKSVPNRTINSSIASLNRLNAEIFLQMKRNDHFSGIPPYSYSQLCKYVQLKVKILLSDDNSLPSARFLKSRSYGLTPTVILNRRLWQKAGNNKKTGRESRSKSKENIIFMSSSNHSLELDDLPSATFLSTGRRPISGRLVLSRPGTAASIKKKKGSVRCHECRKKIGIACRYKCRCGLLFCTTHRYAETHKCTFDYKEEGRRIIRDANPVIAPTKVPEI